MRYKLVLMFYIEPDNARILEYLQACVEVFKQMFPYAQEVDEPFATVQWENNNVTTAAIGKIDKDALP